jgi:hypothetical protein
MTTFTGSPQGCVLSPILFSLYVAEMSTVHPNIHMLKYADDTVILECLHESGASNLQNEMNTIVQWCDTNYLNINAAKTKEMLFTNKRHSPAPPNISIHTNDIERVDSYRYLGTTITSKLSFTTNAELTAAKANKRLYIMKKLHYIKAGSNTINHAYTAFIESILSYHLPIVYGHMSAADKSVLNHTIKTAYRLCAHQLECKNLDELYKARFASKCFSVIHSDDPPIDLDKLPSGRCLVPKYRINARRYCFRSLCAKFYNQL